MRYRKTKREGRTLYHHRVLAEDALGRDLRPDEHVHHRDGDRLNNEAGNLEIISPRDHARLHMAVHPISKTCEVCGLAFEPPQPHRARDRACSMACRNVLIMKARLGERFDRLDPLAISSAHARGQSLRSIGRCYDVEHRTIARILAWPPPLAEAVARSVRRVMGNQ